MKYALSVAIAVCAVCIALAASPKAKTESGAVTVAKTPSLEWSMPAYVKEVKVYAIKVGVIPQKPKRVRPYAKANPFSSRDQAVRFCNGTHSSQEGNMLDCFISDANPNYDYVIETWDQFGDKQRGVVCQHVQAGWMCGPEGKR